MRVGVVSVAVVLLAGAASAKEVFVGELPVSPFVGTEVSTNVPFNVSRNDTTAFTVEMEQNGVESNNVQVAFGQDLDADGDLAPDETDLVLGWRRGIRGGMVPDHKLLSFFRDPHPATAAAVRDVA